MDGLEAVEIKYTDAFRTRERMDAEFYQKGHILMESLLQDHFAQPLGEICDLYDGPFGSDLLADSYSDKGIPLLRMQEITERGTLNSSNMIFICEADAEKYKKYQAFPNELIVTKIGFLGYATVLPSLYRKYIFRREVTRCVLTNLSEYNNYYLSAFLNSKYGRNQCYRYSSGMSRDRILLINQRKLLIPKFSLSLQEAVALTYEAAIIMEQNAYHQYLEAEKTLLERFEIDDTSSNNSGTAIKTFKESFTASGRLDAEYYQPKYSRIVQALNATDDVSSICNLHDKNYIPSLNKEYRYIELANVGDTGNIDGVELTQGKDLPSRARRKVRKGQVIVSSIEGSLTSCALITDEYNDALCSTGFYVVDSDKINSETLLVLFKATPIQSLLKQRCSGTILTAITKDEFLRLPLPYICKETQDHIAQQVQHSFELRKQSKKLLEEAKQTVEIAIEQGENIAVEWLNAQIQG